MKAIAQACREAVEHEGEEAQRLAEKIGDFFDENGFPDADCNPVVVVATLVDEPDQQRCLEQGGHSVLFVLRSGVLVAVMNADAARHNLLHPMKDVMMQVVNDGAQVVFCVDMQADDGVRYVVGKLDKLSRGDKLARLDLN